MRHLLLVSLLVPLLLLLAAGPAEARSWRIEQDGTGEFTTIQPAVDAAASGDTILIGPGHYQDMHYIQPQGDSYFTQVVVYSPPDKSLTYVGAGADQVTIGPDVYDPAHFGPSGIFHDGEQELRVRGVRFINMYSGVLSRYDVDVADCVFSGNNGGIAVVRVSSAYLDVTARDCEFEYDTFQGHGVRIWGGGDVLVDGCTFTESQFYFDGTVNAVVRNSEFNGLVGIFYHSNGLFANNTAALADHSLYIKDASNVILEDNEITGGDYCVNATGINNHVTMNRNILAAGFESTLLIGSYTSATGENNHFLPSNGTYTLTTGGYYGLYPASIDLRNNYWGDRQRRPGRRVDLGRQRRREYRDARRLPAHSGRSGAHGGCELERRQSDVFERPVGPPSRPDPRRPTSPDTPSNRLKPPCGQRCRHRPADAS